MIFFPNRALALFLVLFQWLAVLGQRVKEGCFDAKSSLSCNNPRVDPQTVDFSVVEVCQRMAVEVFPSDDIVFSPQVHFDYINAIEANDEFCDQIEIAYSQCLFCATDWGAITECFGHTWSVSCGDQPTLEQVLESNEEPYAQFQTEDDITRACRDMQGSYAWSFPMTIELCERQTLVKHLCPGYCDGDCFDEVNPPSCDRNAYQGPVNASLDTGAICDQMGDLAFVLADMETVLNVSRHAGYLRAVPNDMCQEARQSYADCTWCDPNMCFDEIRPVSCEPPKGNLNLHTTVEQDEKMCRELFYSFVELETTVDLFNVSQHTKKLPIKNNTELCDQARQNYYRCYWCAQDVPLDFCSWDHNCDGEVQLPEGFVSTTLARMNISMTDSPETKCAEIYGHWNEHWADQYTLHNCYEDAYLAKLCPAYYCADRIAAGTIDQNYLGATTTAQKLALIWMSRVAAILSFLGASYILYDILSDPKRRTVFHTLLVGMAIFDIVTAVAWAFATAPIDKEAAGHVEGAIGTAGTCTAQAFFVQLGFTSVFYNVSLAMYYVLVVAYDWREFQLKKVQVYMHVLPLVVGLGLAFGAIPSYHWLEYGCHLQTPPEGDMWSVLVFVVLPIGLAIVAIMACMMMVYCKVRRQAAKSAKWILGVSKASALEQAVFWQCLFYVLAFLISWPILFAVYLASVDVNGPLGLTLTVAFVAPLQGFNNFLVYIRPKILKQKPIRPSGESSSFWSRASVVARLRRSLPGRTTLGSSSTTRHMSDSTARWLSRPDGSNTSRNEEEELDPSVAMAFRRNSVSAFGRDDSGLAARRAPLSAVLETSQAEEDAMKRSFILSKHHKDTSDDANTSRIDKDNAGVQKEVESESFEDEDLDDSEGWE